MSAFKPNTILSNSYKTNNKGSKKNESENIKKNEKNN